MVGASVLLGGSAGDEVGCCGDGYGDGADEPTKREGNRVSYYYFALFTHLHGTTSRLKGLYAARENEAKRGLRI